MQRPHSMRAPGNWQAGPPTASRRTRDASLISRLVSQRHSLALAGPEGCRAGIRRRTLVGRALSAFREPTAGRRLCRSCTDAMAERHHRSRAGCVQGRQSATTGHDDPACLALAQAPAGLSPEPVVSRTGQGGGRPSQKADDCGAGPEAPHCTMEVRNGRDRDRGSCHQDSLRTDEPPRAFLSRRIQVDEPNHHVA